MRSELQRSVVECHSMTRLKIDSAHCSLATRIVAVSNSYRL